MIIKITRRALIAIEEHYLRSHLLQYMTGAQIPVQLFGICCQMINEEDELEMAALAGRDFSLVVRRCSFGN